VNRVVIFLSLLVLVSCVAPPETSTDFAEPERPVTWQELSRSSDENNISTPNIVNTAPVINDNLIFLIAAGIQYYVRIDAMDNEGDPLTYSASNLPNWLSFDEFGGVLYGAVKKEHAGFYEYISISVSDGEITTELGPFSIVVTDTNNILEISGEPNTSVIENEFYQYIPSIKNVVGSPLTFSIINKPSWATFNENNGKLSGTPGFADNGVYSDILISVSDGVNFTAISPFSINVKNINRAPTIKGQTFTLLEDNTLEFFVSASDPDVDTLNWSIVSVPKNGQLAFINFAEQRISYTPNPDYFGTDFFTLKVTDASGGYAQAQFTININSVNDIPIANPDAVSAINGESQSIYVLNNDYGLGDSALTNTLVTLEIASPPSQGAASINSDGSISYLANDNAASTDSFIYKITDINNESSLASVNISIRNNCTADCTKLVNVSWDPSVSENITGYYLYYGQASRQYDNVYWVGQITSYDHAITASGGPHFYALKAINNLGEISEFSEELSLVF